MKTLEEFVTPDSEYYVYTPSRTALDTFLYPLQCGHFSYLPGYALTRASFDSFLVMYIQKGGLNLSFEGTARHVDAGSFVLIDCYKLHSYSTGTGWECLWCHFDGINARPYYNSVVSHLGNVFSLPQPGTALARLNAVYQNFLENVPVREPLLSKYLTDLLTEFLLCPSPDLRRGEKSQGRSDSSVAEMTAAYINEHFREPLSVRELASRANLSEYHFIRTFKKETGFTPHEYLIHTRMTMAKYLLKNSRLSVKNVCFAAGFSNESVFCSAFRQRQGMTPARYRELEDSRADRT